MMASITFFRPYQPDKGAGKDFPQNKGRGKDQKGKGLARESDDTCFCTMTLTAWMVATALNLANHPTHGRLDRERQSKDSRSMHGIYDGILSLEQIFRVCQLRDRNLQGKLHYPTVPPCSTKFDVLEPGMYMSKMKIWVRLMNWVRKATNLHVQLLVCILLHSTMGHIVLDLTNRAYQPMTKSREQSGHPKRQVTFATSEQRSPYPAHTPEMDEEKMRMINHLCDQHQGRNLLKKRVTQILITKISYLRFLQHRRRLRQCEKRKGPSQ